jgi:transposase
MKNKAPNIKDRKKKSKKIQVNEQWEKINPNAAGIDIGSRDHYACVPQDRDAENVRRFGTTTPELQAMADWLQACGIQTVAMEATGIYWIASFQILEKRGFKVVLVNPRQVKNVTGRKSDVQDCQWIQKLHTFGLLGASFRPADPYCVARTYLRLRNDLVACRSTQIQLMQKALHQMNVQLSHVLSDISGESGMAIISAILGGERNPVALAKLANRRVRAGKEQIARALVGDYRPEHLFALQTAYEMYLAYEAKIRDCDGRLIQELNHLPDKVDLKVKPLAPSAENKTIDPALRLGLYLKLGVDITAIEGIGGLVGLTMLTEVGPDLSAFPSEKHFSSWLGICPDNRISGGKVLNTRTRRVVNRLADALRIAATTLERSQSALGAFYRRMKAKLGAAEAITATAHKLARLIYRLVKHGEAYVQEGIDKYEKKNQERKLKAVRKMAESLGLKILEPQDVALSVS